MKSNKNFTEKQASVSASLGDSLSDIMESLWLDILSVRLCNGCRERIESRKSAAGRALRRAINVVLQSFERSIYILRETLREDTRVKRRKSGMSETIEEFNESCRLADRRRPGRHGHGDGIQNGEYS